MCNDCAVLQEQMKAQEYQMRQMKKTITKLRGELKHERREKDKLIKEKRKKRKNHYRNGKRGTNFNG